jgi:hypothetical protein
MLREFGELLRTFLSRQGIVAAMAVFFDAPNAEFVRRLPAKRQALDIYLVDLRENRKLRSSERTRTYSRNGHGVVEGRAPEWVDAHYLITAWDPSRDPTDADRTLREHQLLRRVSAALLAGEPLTPASVYAPDPVPTPESPTSPGWPEDFHNTELPLQVLPPEGFLKLSDFWTSMGLGPSVLWKPVVYLVATVPLPLPAYPEQPVVTTLLSVLGQTADAAGQTLVPKTAHLWAQIGGMVRERYRDPRTGRPAIRPVKDARIRLEAVTGTALQATRSDDQGRFQFLWAPLPAGDEVERRYVLVARHRQLGEASRRVTLPAADGEYDLEFNPQNL